MNIALEKNKSLKKLNTFGIEVLAKEYLKITNNTLLEKVVSFTKNNNKSIFIFNGGSNILFTKEVKELVLHIQLKGIKIIKESDKEVVIEVQAGENWHKFVMFCVNNNFGGLENLSLIPGNVGTSPIQNIGAYGVEIKDIFYSLKAYDIENEKVKEFTLEECQFGYRDSYFKQAGRGKYIITSVQFKLQKPPHKLETRYGIINQVLEEKKIIKPTIKDISEAVIFIRKSKLPNPDAVGNAGSFFKNPVVRKSVLAHIEKHYPDVPYYVIDIENVKIPAAWLIEKTGWKGKRFGAFGVHEKQPLVLVNYGGATGKEIFNLSEEIIASIHTKFNILLEREVNIY